MRKAAALIVKMRWFIIAFAAIAGIASVFLFLNVNSNYNLASYLPEDSDTIKSLRIMEADFGSTAQLEVMIKDVTVEEAYTYSSQINKIENVAITNFYNNKGYFIDADGDGWGEALIRITISGGDDYSTVAENVMKETEKALSGKQISFGGQTYVNYNMKTTISNEMIYMLLLLLVIVAVILFLVTESWFDPILMGIVIGVSLVINLGTNYFMEGHTVSYITRSVCAILQMALSMDYSIILIHAYNKEISENKPPKEAVINALAASFSAVSASSLTTVAGLAAIMFMTFGIGFDIGLVLVKGIVISMLSVFLLLPGLLLIFNKPIEKLRHKPLLSVKGVNDQSSFVRLMEKSKKAVPAIMVAVIVGAYFLQAGNAFSFVEKSGKDRESAFKTSNQIVFIAPVTGDPAADYERQRELQRLLSKHKNQKGEKILTDTVGYTTTILKDIDAYTASKMMNMDYDTITQLYGTYYLSNGGISEEESRLALKDFISCVTKIMDGSVKIGDFDITKIMTEEQYNLLNALCVLLEGLDKEMTEEDFYSYLSDTVTPLTGAEILSRYDVGLIYTMYHNDINNIKNQRTLTLKSFIDFLSDSIDGGNIYITGALSQGNRQLIKLIKQFIDNIDGAYSADGLYGIIEDNPELFKELGKDSGVIRAYICQLYGMYCYDKGYFEQAEAGAEDLLRYFKEVFANKNNPYYGMLSDILPEETIGNFAALLNDDMTAEELAERAEALLDGYGVSPIELENYIKQFYGISYYSGGGLEDIKMTLHGFLDYAYNDVLNAFSGAIDREAYDMLTAYYNILTKTLKSEMNTEEIYAELNSDTFAGVTGATLEKSYIDILYGMYFENLGMFKVTKDADAVKFTEEEFSAYFLEDGRPILLKQLGIEQDSAMDNLLQLFLRLFLTGQEELDYAQMAASINRRLDIFLNVSAIFNNGEPGYIRNVTEEEIRMMYILCYMESDKYNTIDSAFVKPEILLGTQVGFYKLICYVNSAVTEGDTLYNATLAGFVSEDIKEYLGVLQAAANGIYEISEEGEFYIDQTLYGYAEVTGYFSGLIDSRMIDASLIKQVFIAYALESGGAAGYRLDTLGILNGLKDMFNEDSLFNTLVLDAVSEASGINPEDLKNILTGNAAYSYREAAGALGKLLNSQGFSADARIAEEAVKQLYIMYLAGSGLPSDDYYKYMISEKGVKVKDLLSYLAGITDKDSENYNVIFNNLEEGLLNLPKTLESLIGDIDTPYTFTDLTGLIIDSLNGSGVLPYNFGALEDTLDLSYDFYIYHNPGNAEKPAYAAKEIISHFVKLLNIPMISSAVKSSVDGTSAENVIEYLPMFDRIYYFLFESPAAYSYSELKTYIDMVLIATGYTGMIEFISLDVLRQVYVKSLLDSSKIDLEKTVTVEKLMNFSYKNIFGSDANGADADKIISAAVMEKDRERMLEYKNQLDTGERLFKGDSYYRVIFLLNLDYGNSETFEFIKTMRQDIKTVYGENSDTCITGYSVGLYEINSGFKRDMLITAVISVLAILIIIAFTFKSFIIPLLLVLTIQGAVWISLSVSTITGSPIFFMSYIIVTCIQMGATIDYAILMCGNYLTARKTMDKTGALVSAINNSLMPILTSGLILTVSGYIISRISTSLAVSTVGNLLARGTIVSVALVLVLLPQMLLLLDKFITRKKAGAVKN